ncbi:MAG: DUF2490 domain-containing protein [Candidatus Margulisbacteria bacterium]|nr:DUF2490 domain-containing protein [Candidatus Margulisiibacteriota bacterium]
MLKKTIVLSLLVLLFGSLALADTEFWSTDTFQAQIKEGVRFNIIPELRFRNNASEFYYLLVYLGPTFKLNECFDLNVFYAPKTTKNGGAWTSGSNGYLDLVYKNGGLSNRGRLENDFTNGGLKIRDQLQYKMNGWFFTEELFYSATKGYFDENRALVGYTFKLAKNFDLSPGYLLRSQKANANADWRQTNVFTLNASLKI